MKQLAWLCEHGEFKAHPAHNGHAISNFDAVGISAQFGYEAVEDCPGGQLVPADARIWWCLEHECTFQKDYLINCDAKEGNERAEDYVSFGSLSRPCRRVGAWLIVEVPEEPPKDPWDYDP